MAGPKYFRINRQSRRAENSELVRGIRREARGITTGYGAKIGAWARGAFR